MIELLRRDAGGVLWRNEVRACLALSWPLVVTNMIETALNLTSVLMVGRLGPEPLAACILGLALYHLCLLFGIGVLAALSPLIARELGRPDGSVARVRRTVQQGLWGAALITGPMWIGLWNVEALLRWIGEEPTLAARAGSYLHALQWAILPTFVYLVLRSLFAAMQRPRWTVVTGAGAVLLNLGLNVLLVRGHGGIPAYGLFGSGLATLLSSVFMAGALGLVVLLEPRFAALRVFAGWWGPDWTGFGAFWRLGLPIGIGLMLETGMFAAAAALIGRFGADALAAHAIALQVASCTFMVPLGLAQAATVRIGHASGAHDRGAVVRAGSVALGLGLAAMTLSSMALIGAPRAIISLFLDDPATVEPIAVTLLGLAGLFQLADGGQVVLSGMLRGLQDTRAPMLIAAVGYWCVGLPLGIVLAFSFGMGAPGVWTGMTVGLFTAAILLLARWRHRLRRTTAASLFVPQTA